MEVKIMNEINEVKEENKEEVEWDISGYEFNRTPTIGDLRKIDIKGEVISQFKDLKSLDDIPDDLNINFNDLIDFGLPLLNMTMSKGIELTENTPIPLFFKLMTSDKFNLDFLGMGSITKSSKESLKAKLRDSRTP